MHFLWNNNYLTTPKYSFVHGPFTANIENLNKLSLKLGELDMCPHISV